MNQQSTDGPADKSKKADESQQAGPEPIPALWDEAAQALPGVARIATRAAFRSAAWGLGSGMKTSRLMLRALSDPQAAEELVQEVARDLSEASRAVNDVADAVSAGVPLPRALLDATMSLSTAVLSDDTGSTASFRSIEQSSHGPQPTLRQRGESLLQRSRDVWREDETHPAYARILDELAPDEARILLLLLHGGPQPTVDVRTGGPVGLVSSALVAPGMSMIGPRAGCRHLEEVPAYLNNLFRLGLIWFSREQLEDSGEYQVVEAQPDVLAAMHSVRFPKMVRRSIHLTPFGTGFCRACLADPVATLALPAHHIPEE